MLVENVVQQDPLMIFSNIMHQDYYVHLHDQAIVYRYPKLENENKKIFEKIEIIIYHFYQRSRIGSRDWCGLGETKKNQDKLSLLLFKQLYYLIAVW